MLKTVGTELPSPSLDFILINRICNFSGDNSDLDVMPLTSIKFFKENKTVVQLRVLPQPSENVPALPFRLCIAG